MKKADVTEIVQGATCVAYPDKYKYCMKVVEALGSIAVKKNVLENKEVEIVSAMCSLCMEGGNYMHVESLQAELERCGVAPVCDQVLRNYWTSIRKKGWLNGRQFNMKMLKAIKEGRMTLLIFFDRGKS